MPPRRKTVLITGCTPGGIGAALAYEFHARGHLVIPTARRLSALAPLADAGMHPLALDVTSTASIAACHAAVRALLGDAAGGLDVLVNNAGLSVPAPAAELDVDGAVRAMFDTNVLGPMRVTQAFTGLLMAAAEDAGEPVVVNIGSIAPSINFTFGGGYNATKAALATWGDALRVELAPFGVGVVTVVTGAVRSNIVANNVGLELREGSLYAPIAEWWRKRVGASQTEGPMEAGVYAKGVVDMVERRGRRVEWFWYGGRARLAWWVGNVFPRWMVDWIVGRKYGMGVLAEYVKKERRARVEAGKAL
ncbi:NAD(P)-binding protein [Geopyxis carbonaria]|nr:NAD(P)-binding protein [Geopyxis carbonaria]